MLKGTIVKNISNKYTVMCQDKLYDCTPRGKFRFEKKVPLVGDYCMIDEENCYIIEILERKNELQRPNVSNVDVALIVTSMKQPDFNATLLDKEISSVILESIEPVICFTKIDLLSDEEIKQYQELRAYYQRIGIYCFDNTELNELKSYLKEKYVVLTGQTGAGKSTLLNKLALTLNLKTNEISFALNRGKHTTRHTEIFTIDGIHFFDTPGFSSLELENKTKEEIRDSFIDFQEYHCKFQDCMHLKENVCGVKEAREQGKILDSRYSSYQRMIDEVTR